MITYYNFKYYHINKFWINLQFNQIYIFWKENPNKTKDDRKVLLAKKTFKIYLTNKIWKLIIHI
jgi:hypothetical protein